MSRRDEAALRHALYALRHPRGRYSADRASQLCVAKEAAFDALVSRDFSQADQAAEMFALSRLTDFDV